MPANIVIPPNYWGKKVAITTKLVDQYGNPFPAQITDGSGWVAGTKAWIAATEQIIITIPCNDELPSPPNETPPVGSFWLISVHAGELEVTPKYHVQISSASPPSNWNELIAAGTPVDPADIWSGRLLPPDAQPGQYTRKASGPGWEAVDPPTGTGDVIGPTGAIDGNLAVFDGTTGKLIKDGGPPGSGGGIPEAPSDGDLYGRKNTAWVVVTPSAIAAVPVSRKVEGTQSIVDGGDLSADRTLRLFGDVPAPGSNKLYGTDNAGARGWYERGILDAPSDGGLYARKNDAWTTWLPADIGAVPESRQVSGLQSIAGGGALSGNLNFTLLNDQASPGANMLYGTDGAGIKGWHDQPTGGAGSTNLGNVRSANDVQITSSSGSDTTIGAATTLLAGFMSSAQTVALNNAATQTELNGKIGALVEDPAPVAGGNLTVGGSNNRQIFITDTSDTRVGAIGFSQSSGNGIFLGYKAGPDPYDVDNGGILASPGQLVIGGSSIVFDRLQHAQPEGFQELRVTTNGSVFSVAPRPQKWSVSDTSDFQHDFTNGKDLGPWVLVSNLSIMPPQDVSVGERIDVQVNLRIQNIEEKIGSLIIGIGVDGANPTGSGVQVSISADADTVIPLSISSATHGGITTAQTLNVFARRGASSDDAHIFLRGDLALHELFVSGPTVPGGAGAPTDLSTIYTASTFTIQSSTGMDAVVADAVAGSSAGALSAARAAAVDSALQNGSNITHWNPISQNLGQVAGTAAANIANGPVIIAEQTAQTTFTFSSTPDMPNMPFTLILKSGGFTPLFAFPGATLYEPAARSWTADGFYWISFQRDGSNVFYTQALMVQAP